MPESLLQNECQVLQGGEIHGMSSIEKVGASMMKCKGIQCFLVQVLMLLLLLPLTCCRTASMVSTYPALPRASISAHKLAHQAGLIAPSPSPFTASKSAPRLPKFTKDIKSEHSELPTKEEISSRSGASVSEMDRRLRRHLIGSSMPHCGHTCGACVPCELRIVVFECDFETGTHAEACPLGYSCTCNGKLFPVP